MATDAEPGETPDQPPQIQMAPEGRETFGICRPTLSDNRWVFSSGLNPHPNPRFYKYLWVINYAGPPVEGWQPQGKVRLNGICTYDAMRLFQLLQQSGRGCVYDNAQYRRIGAGSPFVIKDIQDVAPAFDSDRDPIWGGEFWLRGHR